MNKLALLLPLALTGCTCNEFSNNFLVDARFDHQFELDTIHHVADEMREAFDSDEALLTFEVSPIHEGEFTIDNWEEYDGEHAKLYRITRDEEGYADMTERLEKDFTGASNFGRTVVLVSENYMTSSGVANVSQMEKLLMHEFGHHFGLHHGDGNIMVEKTDTDCGTCYQCIDQTTIDSFCAIHECGPKAHSTCKE